MDLPGHVASVAPGMDFVVVAGEKYTLKDDNDKELQLVGREREWTIDFLKAFDNYMDAAGRLGDENEHVQAFAKKLREVWFAMPDDLTVQMPSFTDRGISINVHQH